MDGNPCDACSIASFIAMNCTKIPKTILAMGESGFMEDFDVIGDLFEAGRINCNKLPIIISIVKVIIF
jgi:exosome complex RNA-binding protein Rrp42 (RNase PH superfamily)